MDTENQTPVTTTEQPSPFVSNNPTSMLDEVNSMRDVAEADLKAELLKELSLDDVRNLIALARSGAVVGADAPDTFDQYGRNFHRNVRRVERMTPGGAAYNEEVQMAKTLKEAQDSKSRMDYFDPTTKIWIIRGRKREVDYPENTVEFWKERSDSIGAR